MVVQPAAAGLNALLRVHALAPWALCTSPAMLLTPCLPARHTNLARREPTLALPQVLMLPLLSEMPNDHQTSQRNAYNSSVVQRASAITILLTSGLTYWLTGFFGAAMVRAQAGVLMETAAAAELCSQSVLCCGLHVVWGPCGAPPLVPRSAQPAGCQRGMRFVSVANMATSSCHNTVWLHKHR